MMLVGTNVPTNNTQMNQCQHAVMYQRKITDIAICHAIVLEMFSGAASKQCNVDYFSPCSPLLS